MLKFKNLVAFSLAVSMMVSVSGPALAITSQDSINSNFNEYILEYGVTEDELLNLSSNFKKALSNIQNSRVYPGDKITVPVSENFTLELSASEHIENSITQSNTYRRTVTSKLALKNLFGGTVVSLTSVGTFITNGSTSVPEDAYGTYKAFVWNVTNTSSSKGSPSYNSWVRNSFSGEFNIGIDPVHVTIQSFNTSCTIHCDANGVYSASWS